MFKNLLAAIESDINALSIAQDAAPHDVNIIAKKLQLKEIAMQYIGLENKYKEIALNSIY